LMPASAQSGSGATFDLTGRVALVTGGGRGLGSAIVHTLARHGATVAVNDIDPDRADHVVRAVAVAGGSGLAAVADVTNGAAVADVVAAIAARVGSIDILINNAGIPATGVSAGPFAESAPERWHELVDLNLFAVLHSVRAVLPGMIARKWGRIVTIVSDAARVGEPNLAVYAAAKAGAAAFSRSIAKEVGQYGVTSNCVSLGSLVTERTAPQAMAKAVARYPAGRLGQPGDVTPVVLLLVSEEAAWITGQTYGVDGGYAPS
jgi:2-hydroxycyclohexanecarboxyl-CoA dehydrogenase